MDYLDGDWSKRRNNWIFLIAVFVSRKHDEIIIFSNTWKLSEKQF